MQRINLNEPLSDMDIDVFITLMKQQTTGSRLFLKNKTYSYIDKEGDIHEVQFSHDIVRRPSVKNKHPKNLWRYDVVDGDILSEGGQARVRLVLMTIRIDDTAIKFRTNHPRVAKEFTLPNADTQPQKRARAVHRSIQEYKILNDVGGLNVKELAGDDDTQILVMRRLFGHDLMDEFTHLSGMPFTERLVLFIDIIKAVKTQLHDRTNPIIHRDLKPDNLYREIILPDGRDESVIRVMDFGLSTYKDKSERPEHVGTIIWAAPEQIDTFLDLPASLATDAFSIGRMGGFLMGDSLDKYLRQGLNDNEACRHFVSIYKTNRFDTILANEPDVDDAVKVLVREVVGGLQSFYPSDRMSLTKAEKRLSLALAKHQKNTPTPIETTEDASIPVEVKKSSPRRQLLSRALAKFSFHAHESSLPTDGSPSPRRKNNKSGLSPK